LPIFVLANVIVDFEVLFGTSRFPHRVWHFHTLLVGTIVGAVFGLSAYPARGIFKKIMELLRLSYRPSLLKMVISGVLGVWLHVVIDAIYHWDVWLFWPNKTRPLWNLLTQQQVKVLCIAFLAAAIVLYLVILAVHFKRNRK
jgi:membrane-bound metal-dependent hydrolase YbcI (DUF457 family)